MLKTPDDFLPRLALDASDEALTFVCHRDALLLHETTLEPPSAAHLRATALAGADAHALGLWGGRECRLVLTDTDADPPPGYRYARLRSLFGLVDDGFLALAGRATQLADWARTNRYCGVCATPMARMPTERAYHCPACGFTAYPRICPAMMVLIRKGDQVLLALHTKSPVRRYTALAGFVEAGESVEEAVHREVFEEVGLRVHNLRYFQSQSWPFPNSLMIAFTADYLDGEIRTDPEEIEDARWFGPDDAWPEIPHSVSIASALLEANRPR